MEEISFWVIATVIIAIGMACTNVIGYIFGRRDERKHWETKPGYLYGCSPEERRKRRK